MPSPRSLTQLLSVSFCHSPSSMSLSPIFWLGSSISRLYDHAQTPHSVERLWTSDQSDA